MSNQLEQLKSMSLMVGDCIDISLIKRFLPSDVNISSAQILHAIQQPENEYLIKNAIESAQSERWGYNYKQTIIARLAIGIGAEILKNIPGRIAIDIDASLSFDTDGMVSKARELIDVFRSLRIDNSRILIKIPATWEGIMAARQLERERINCNLTMVYGFIQAQACAEAGVFLISVPVAPVSDWYKTNEPNTDSSYANGVGIENLNHIYQNYKYFGVRTQIMASHFYTVEQVQLLAGCDRLAIAPLLLDELTEQTLPLTRQLNKPETTENASFTMTEKEFRWHLNSSVMANAKLAEDIRILAEHQRQIEDFINQYLQI